MLVPSPAFRSMALGIMLSVDLHPRGDAHPAARGAGQARPARGQGEPAVGALRRAPFAAVRRLGRAPVKAPGRLRRASAVVVLLALAVPVLNLQTGMPSIKVVPDGDSRAPATTRSSRRSGRALRERCRSSRRRRRRSASWPRSRPTRASRASCRRSRRRRLEHGAGHPTGDPSGKPIGATVDRLRGDLPEGALVGGAVAENHDLEAALSAKTPLVIGVVLALGFLLLLVALQAPLLAAAAVLTNLLATGAAFGVARLIFQEGHLSGLLGSSPRGSSTRGRRCSSSRWSSPSRWTTRCSCCPPPRSMGPHA